jgi:hypothetical protein
VVEPLAGRHCRPLCTFDYRALAEVFCREKQAKVFSEIRIEWGEGRELDLEHWIRRLGHMTHWKPHRDNRSGTHAVTLSGHAILGTHAADVPNPWNERNRLRAAVRFGESVIVAGSR